MLSQYAIPIPLDTIGLSAPPRAPPPPPLGLHHHPLRHQRIRPLHAELLVGRRQHRVEIVLLHDVTGGVQVHRATLQEDLQHAVLGVVGHVPSAGERNGAVRKWGKRLISSTRPFGLS